MSVRRKGHKNVCESDDCPCYTAGITASFLEIDTAREEMVQAARQVIEMLHEPSDGEAIEAPT